MKIHTMGDGLFDNVLEEVEGKPCLLLVADTREELSAALQDIGFSDDVTVVRRASASESKALNAVTLPELDRRVSALFVDPDGHYPKLVADCWGTARDARNYDGPLPVVAHPPCQLWVNFAALNYSRYGGGHNRPGNDGGMFASALASIRRWGGVLEHPADSRAWQAHGLVAPGDVGWTQTALCEWTCEVWQSAYGHPARKRTWLYYCGRVTPLEACWDRREGTHQVGWFDRKKPTLGKKAANETPAAFAAWLIELAARSTDTPCATPKEKP